MMRTRRLPPSRLAERFFKDRAYRIGICVKGAHLDAAVMADYQPEEHDTNTPEGVEIWGAFVEDEGCQLDNMTDGELRDAEAEILALWHEYASSYYEDSE